MSDEKDWIMDFTVFKEDGTDYEYPKPEPSRILIEIVEDDIELKSGPFPGFISEEIQYEGGSAEIEAEAGMLEYSLGDIWQPPKAGWWIIEGFFGRYTHSYEGDVDCDFSIESFREATDEDRKHFGV